jgi:hypothetical protein
MGLSHKATDLIDPQEQTLRDQEVLRANRELAAYFRGRRTGREAWAALKTIKAYIRDRERLDPVNRPPLPRSLAVRTRARAAGATVFEIAKTGIS